MFMVFFKRSALSLASDLELSSACPLADTKECEISREKVKPVSIGQANIIQVRTFAIPYVLPFSLAFL